MISGVTGVAADVVPFGMVFGNRGVLTGLNIIGLSRRGFERAAIHRLRAAFHLLFAGEGVFAQRLEELRTDLSPGLGVSLGRSVDRHVRRDQQGDGSVRIDLRAFGLTDGDRLVQGTQRSVQLKLRRLIGQHPQTLQDARRGGGRKAQTKIVITHRETSLNLAE